MLTWGVAPLEARYCLWEGLLPRAGSFQGWVLRAMPQVLVNQLVPGGLWG